MEVRKLCLVAVGLIVAATALAPARAWAEKQQLTFAAITTEEMNVVAGRWDQPLQYVGKKLGAQVDFYATTSYAAVVEAMIGGFVDFAMLGPKIYIVAREKADFIEPINGTGRPPNRFMQEPCACYHGRLITKKGGEFTTIASLEGGVLALVEPGSTSGSALPRALFPDEIGGKLLEDYFGEVFYAGAHDAAAKAVLAGKADAAFVSENALSRAIDRGAIPEDAFNHLWVSPEVVSNPIVVNTKTMPREMIDKLSAILADMDKDPEGQEMLKQLKMAALPPLTDKKFDPLRRILAEEAKEN